MVLGGVLVPVLAVSSAERFVRENAVALAIGICLVLGFLALRLAVKVATRLVLVGVLAASVLFVIVERDDFEACAVTCSCNLAGQDLTIGSCGSGLTDLGR